LIADRARLRVAKRIERLAGYRLSDRAFNGTMLETLSSGINYDSFDFAVREQILAFFNDFLRCDCRGYQRWGHCRHCLVVVNRLAARYISGPPIAQLKILADALMQLLKDYEPQTLASAERLPEDVRELAAIIRRLRE